MSGENQYISPIIDAFLRRRQQDLQANQESAANQQRQASIENENKYRESLIKESGARLEEAHRKAVADEELRQQQHENASLATKAAIQQHIADAVRNAPEGESQGDLAAINKIRALGGQGVLKGSNSISLGPEANQQLPGSPTTQLQMPGGGPSFGIEGMPTASEAAANVASAAGTKAGAISDATIDNKLLQDNNKSQQRHQNDMDLTKQKGEQILKQMQVNNASKEEIANMQAKMRLEGDYAHNATTLKAAQIHMGAGFDAATAGNLAERGHHLGMEILDGKGDYTKLPLPDKYAVDAWGQANGIEIPKTSAYSQTISALDSLPALYDQTADAIHRYSKDSKPIPADPKTGELGSEGGGKWTAAVAGNKLANLAGVGIGMDAAQKQIQANAGTLAQQNDPKARQTMAIISSQTAAAFNPNLTEAENMRNLNNAKAKNSQKLDNDVFNGLPKPIADTIKVRRGLAPLEPAAGTPTVPTRASNSLPGPVPGHVPWPNATKAKGYNIYGSGPEPSNWQDYQNQFPPNPSQSPIAVPATNPQVAQ